MIMDVGGNKCLQLTPALTSRNRSGSRWPIGSVDCPPRDGRTEACEVFVGAETGDAPQSGS